MNIVFGRENLAGIDSKNTILTVDAFKVNGQLIECFCLLSIEDMPLVQLPTIDKDLELHESLIKEYRNKNWNYCQDAIKGLKGKFNGVLDEFYTSVEQRISQPVDENWHWAINKGDV
jgi:hypothetical protein